MKKHTIFISLAIFFVFVFTINKIIASDSTSSLKGKISGFVFDRQTKQPIPDANIIISGTHLGAASHDGGYYFIDNIPKGNYDITVRVIGYQIQTRKEVNIGKETLLNFALTPKTIQIDPILVTATRSDHLQSKVTVSCEVLSLPRIKEQNGNTAAEVIESVGGLYVKDNGGFAGLKSPSIRGSNTSQVLVLLDGQRLNSTQDGGIDINTLPVETLERIEIIRGGHSALLGTDAIGGVIHLITRDSQPSKGYLYSIQSTIGSFGTQNNSFYGSHKIGPLQLFFNYNHLHSDGNFKYTYPETGADSTRKNNDFRGNNVFFKAKINLRNRNQIRFIHQSIQNKRGVAGLTKIDPFTQTSMTTPKARRDEVRKIYILQSENQLTNRLRLKEQFFYLTYKNHYMNPAGWIPEDDTHKNSVRGLEIQSQWTANSHLILTTIFELREDRLKSTKFDKQKRNTASLLLQTEIDHAVPFLNKKLDWKWTPALRWDNYTDISTQYCPKLGTVISLNKESNVAFRGNIGKSFRVPTFNDLYWPESAWTKGNPDLNPEISTHFDVGFLFKQEKSFFFQTELNYFISNIKDLIEWSPSFSGVWMPLNVGKAKISGLESGFEIRLQKNLAYLKIFHTWMKATDNSPDSPNKGNRLIYRPDRKLDISAGLNLSPITMNVNYRIVTKRFTSSDNSNTLPQYRILDGNIGFSFSVVGLNIDTKLQAQNLLNKSIFILDGYPLPGREFRFSFGLRY